MVVVVRAEHVGVIDPGGLVGWHEHKLEEPTAAVGADHERSQLPAVLLLHEADRVVECMEHVVVGDPVLPSTLGDLHSVIILLTIGPSMQ